MVGRLAIAGALLAILPGWPDSADAARVPEFPAFNGLGLDLRAPEFASNCANQSICTKTPSGFSNVAVSANDGRSLFWDRHDGFGILGGEDDEIDGGEQLTVSFGQGTGFGLSGIALTNLFMPDDGGADGEEAFVQLFFNGEEVGPSGGLHFTQTDANIFGATLLSLEEIVTVDTIIFRSSGELDDEYSVAGLAGVLEPDPDMPIVLPPDDPRAPGQTGSGGYDEQASVALPPTLLLVLTALTGLAGLAGLRRSARPCRQA